MKKILALVFVATVLSERNNSKWKKKDIVDQFLLWPDKIVFYRFDEGFSIVDKMRIQTVISKIQRKTCLQFKKVLNISLSSVLITPLEKGCFSSVGYSPISSDMILNLDNTVNEDNCMENGKIEHELFHTLGFDHEHTRSDRESFIKIHWNKIKYSKRNQYFRNKGKEEKSSTHICNSKTHLKDLDICSSGITVENYGPYDYESIMHYSHSSHGINPNRPTFSVLQSVQDKAKIGQRNGGTKLDYEKINKAYQC